MADIQEKSSSSAPYEVPLTKAFDKLTSQVFIFLLAYVILLIGLAVFGANLASTLRNLLYVIPILGVVAYVWLQHQEIVKRAGERGVDIKKGIVVSAHTVEDQAKIVGVTGVQGEEPDNVSVDVDRASGSAQVIGKEYATLDDHEESQSIDAQQLINIFNQLDSADQNKLLMTALRMRQKASGDP